MKKRHIIRFLVLTFAVTLPLIEMMLPESYRISPQLRPILIFSILGLGLNILTGYTGLLNLGVAAFMAIGAFTYGILTCDIFPFQVGFWGGVLLTVGVGGVTGFLLGLPTIRLRGDYLAIVTLGFGEIVQDILRNLESITKGTQGINPLPYPSLFGYELSSSSTTAWYYLLLAFVLMVVVVSRNLERSRIGREWIAIREDELAARSMGIKIVNSKLLAFSIAAAVCSLAGALWASYLSSTGEPGNYDFQLSVIALCIVIVGGMGNVAGVLLGAVVMVGCNSIVLTKLAEALQRNGLASTTNVLASPGNWKYAVFGLALILMMRFRPEGLLPSRRVQAELR